jgi:heat shock protein HtpX
MNTLKTAFLLTALTLFLIFIGAYFGGRNGMILAFFIAAGMNFFSYFYSDKLALSMYRAQPVTREQLPRVYQIVERILPRMALPMPKIYVIPNDSPNAFATGRNPQHAAVAVTQGILNLLNDEELEGVLAHELGHVRNRDILTSSIAATLAGAITLLAQTARFASIFGGGSRDGRRGMDGGGLFMLILAPIAATLIQLAVSRSREYEAMPLARMSREILTPWPAHCKSSMPTPNACRCRLRLRLRIYLSSRPLLAGRASLISFPPIRRWPAV